MRDVFQMVDEGVQPRMLRKTLESVANAFLQQNKITAHARELLTYVLHHSGATASEVDYTRPMHDEQIPADRGDDEEPSEPDNDDGDAGGEPDAGTPPAAERRVCWFSEVAARTEELYFRGGDEITLIRLHAALAMAATVAGDHATDRQLHHAGAACDMMTERKRQRIE